MSLLTDQERGRFARQRRRQALAVLGAQVRRRPADWELLSFDDVVRALGQRGQADLGIQAISVDSIVGTVGRGSRDFDRAFRPGSRRIRDRWLRVAAARRHDGLPAIEAYRIGDLHFVEDGHHRVSVARAMGDVSIDAHVRVVRTALPLPADLVGRDLPLKHHERSFHERIPLPRALRDRIELTDEWRYAQLAALIEAWGYRESHARGRVLTPQELALEWYRERYEPIVAVLREGGLGGPGTDTDRYLRFMMLRYLLLHKHDWSDEIVEELKGAIRPPTREDDTLVHQLLREMT